MRFLVIDKVKQKFTNEELKNLMKSYRDENYETVISSRLDGRKFEVVVKEVGNRVKGTILVASDSSNLYILDIVGRVAIDKAASLFKAIDGNSDIGQKVRDFVTKDNRDGKKDKKVELQID